MVFGVIGALVFPLVSAHPVLDLGTSTGHVLRRRTEEETVKDLRTEVVQYLALLRVLRLHRVHLLPMTRQLRVDQQMKTILPH